jgi:hypothetical protein
MEDYKLSQIEQAQLAAFIPTDGFQILDKIMKGEVAKFNTKLLNCEKPEDVLIAHNLASAAAKFYQGLINTVNAEVYSYINTPKSTDEPVDVTEGFLDM